MTISFVRSACLRLAYSAAVAATLAAPLFMSSAEAGEILAPPPPTVVAVPLWTGFYIGLHGGGGQGNSHLEDPDFQLTYLPISLKSNGWLAGAQMGADWQFGSVVIGGEMDVSSAAVKGSLAPDPAVFLSGLSVTYRALATATGRAGFAAGNLLGYAKAGLAWANIDYKSALGSPFPIDVNHQRTGLTAGAGIETALFANLSAKLEYDYVYFGPAAISLGTRRNPSNVDHELHLLKLGLNWRINGDYLLARY